MIEIKKFALKKLDNGDNFVHISMYYIQLIDSLMPSWWLQLS